MKYGAKSLEDIAAQNMTRSLAELLALLSFLAMCIGIMGEFG